MTTVEVQIGEQGLVTDARVLASSGRADLDEAALAGIRRCVFHAVLATGQAPTGWLKTQYVWVSGEAKQAQAAYEELFARTRQRAEAALAMLIEAGRAGSAAPAEAASLYRKAMQWRHPGAYYRYGLILEQHGDDQLAAALFRQGAALGDCEAATKYLQLRQAQAPSAHAPTSDIYLAHRAQACAAGPELPPQL
ncbi:energy transducer TonB [Massilia sp. X63]|uniref:energy transducer TonB n=1 Tax=Massilia sp. X63 TaxID=3237285 RepID=UPI0034DCD7D5